MEKYLYNRGCRKYSSQVFFHGHVICFGTILTWENVSQLGTSKILENSQEVVGGGLEAASFCPLARLCAWQVLGVPRKLKVLERTWGRLATPSKPRHLGGEGKKRETRWGKGNSVKSSEVRRVVEAKEGSKKKKNKHVFVCVCGKRYNFAAGRNQRIGKMDTSSKQQRTYEESESGIR